VITVEHEFDGTVVTIVDPEGKYEDVQLISDSSGWYIRQWNEDLGGYEVVELSSTSFNLLLQSLTLPEGAYIVEFKNDD
jgi:hypothetical protein